MHKNFLGTGVTSGSSLLLSAQESSAQPGFCGGLPPGGGGYTLSKLCACNFELPEWGIVEAANPSTVVCAELPETTFAPVLCSKMISDGRLIGLRGTSRVHSADRRMMSANTSTANLAITTKEDRNSSKMKPRPVTYTFEDFRVRSQ